jgi:hypothetical protein
MRPTKDAWFAKKQARKLPGTEGARRPSAPSLLSVTRPMAEQFAVAHTRW